VILAQPYTEVVAVYVLKCGGTSIIIKKGEVKNTKTPIAIASGSCFFEDSVLYKLNFNALSLLYARILSMMGCEGRCSVFLKERSEFFI